MKQLLIKIILLIFVSSIPCYGSQDIWELFQKALSNGTTSPNYVLVTIVDGKTEKKSIVCIETPNLLQAIQNENGISEKKDPFYHQAIKIALQQKDRVFRFSKKDALKLVQPLYTEAILSEVQKELKGTSENDLRRDFTGEKKGLAKIYMDSNQGAAYRDAIAYVMLERGLLPRRGCYIFVLTIDKE